MSKNNHGGTRPGSGRPKGASNFRRLFNNVVSDAEKEALIIKLLEIAKDDNNKNQFNAIKELLVISLGKAKDTVQFEVVGETLSEKAESILEACAAGDLPVSDASSLIGSLRQFIDLTDYDGLIDRLKEVMDEKQIAA